MTALEDEEKLNGWREGERERNRDTARWNGNFQRVTVSSSRLVQIVYDEEVEVALFYADKTCISSSSQS